MEYGFHTVQAYPAQCFCFLRRPGECKLPGHCEIHAKRKDVLKVKKFPALFLVLSIVFLLAACEAPNPRVPADVDDYIGTYYETVVAAFQKAGFTDVETAVVNDLTSTSAMDDGAVGRIQINDTDSFSAGDEFPSDTKILITYHIIKKLNAPVPSSSIQEKTGEELRAAFVEAGFTNVSFEEVYDLDPDTLTREYKNDVSINGKTSFTKTEDIPFDADVSIICHYPYTKHTVQMHIDFIGNLIFSKYNVALALDGTAQGTLDHGMDGDFTFGVKEGEHTFTFSDVDSASTKGEVTLDVTCDIDASYKISCYSDHVAVTPIFVDYKNPLAENETKVMGTASSYWGDNYEDVVAAFAKLGFTNIKTVPLYDIYWGITSAGATEDVTISGSGSFKRGDIFLKDSEVVITYHLSYEDDPNYQPSTENTEDTGNIENQESEVPSKTPEPSAGDVKSVSYSTNDLETAKKGNSGVFSYKRSGSYYDIYWIIDFDEGYVYYFQEGEGNFSCDRVKIESGDLNSNVLITYHAGSDTWTEALNFKWKNQPDILIHQDADAYPTEYRTTDLDDALALKDTKTIIDY